MEREFLFIIQGEFLVNPTDVSYHDFKCLLLFSMDIENTWSIV